MARLLLTPLTGHRKGNLLFLHWIVHFIPDFPAREGIGGKPDSPWMDSFAEPIHSMVFRWALAFAFALGIALLALRVPHPTKAQLRKSRPLISQVRAVELLPRPTRPPSPSPARKSQPSPARHPRTPPAPVARMPLSPDSESSGLEAPVAVPAPVRIRSARDLDNIAFDPIFNPLPDYPQIARASNIEGYVDVDLLVNEHGRVVDYVVIRSIGHPSFALQTKKTIGRWRFPPPRIAGRKTRVRHYYRVNFTLD